MILGQFGLPLTIAGALVLAGIVYALQRLRAQPRVLRLPTAGLWAQAMRAAPVRVLGGRFRYLEPVGSGRWSPVTLRRDALLSFYYCSAYSLDARGGAAARRTGDVTGVGCES